MTKRLACLAWTILLLASCSSKPPGEIEQPIKQKSTIDLLPKLPNVLSRPASRPEVDATIKRIFGDVVVVEHAEHSYVTGDFNGDGSPDLATIVHPVRTKLKQINLELANWTVQDAEQFFAPSSGQRLVIRERGTRVLAHADEPLLAVLHGVGNEGWRDARARQTYLIRHAACGSLRAVPIAGHIGEAPETLKNSDVIFETLSHPGYLFWTGSQYAWSSARNRSPGKSPLFLR